MDGITSIINNANMAQEINQAKNFAIKSNNIINEVKMDLIPLKSEININNTKINLLINKLETLCDLLSEKNNNDPSYNYNNL